MTLPHALAAFSERLGHRFRSPDLLVRALTQGLRSSQICPGNQRLEFLGDRVLGLVMAEAVLAQDPDATEGQLAPRFNALVRGEACADVAREIDLGAVLQLSPAETSPGGRRRTVLLGDAMEAVIAAVYEDAGLDAAREVILRLWGDRIATTEADARDAKSTLQEWAQARGQAPPAYREVARAGPDHAPLFRIEATLASGQSEQAQAASKRAAEQRAARALLERLT